METGDNRVKTIEYRLDKIDTQLDALKTLMVDSKLQEKDIKSIYARIEKLEADQSEIREKLEELEDAPTKKSAMKWDFILDYIFKALVAAAVLFIFVRLGIQ